MEKEPLQFDEENMADDKEREETVEDLDAAIETLVRRLDNFDFNSFSPERQEEWYWVEQEANVGKDRAQAKARLEVLIQKLEEESQKSKE